MAPHDPPFPDDRSRNPAKSALGDQRAVILGGNGQDGSYLAEHLVANDIPTYAIGRQPLPAYPVDSLLYQYRQVDVGDENALAGLLEDIAPTRIYHLAAIHGAAGFFYEDKWQKALQVNVGSVHVCLEYIRRLKPDARLIYASSLKAFGSPPPETVSEESPRISTCLYSITKNAASDLIAYYRQRHDVRASVVYLFNHDSPRRPANFFLPRVTGLLAAAMRGESKGPPLHDLDFSCDWGASDEFIAIAHALLEREENQDYVLASGRTVRARDFVEELFASAGLDWQQHITLIHPEMRGGGHHYEADLSRMCAVLGYEPKRHALDVAHWILRENYGLMLPDSQNGGRS